MATLQQTAFLFPGQGSQSVGMMASLADASPVVIETFGEASEVLGFDLWRLVSEGPETELDLTENTQPAVLVADIATWRAYRSAGGGLPAHVAGHSLGEYAALVVAGSLAFADAVRLVAARGRYMQEAVPEGSGAMAAVLGLDDEVLEKLCREQANGEVVACANYNAPGQIVIAGHRHAVERVCAAARDAGAKRALRLPVSVPSHCELMRPAAVRLAEDLREAAIQPPRIPVWHNTDASTHDDPEAIRTVLSRQQWQPVHWARTIQRLEDLGVTRFVECGPGKVLSGLNRRIVKRAETVNLDDLERVRAMMADAGTADDRSATRIAGGPA